MTESEETTTTPQKTTITESSTEMKMINIRDIPGWIATNVKDTQPDNTQLSLLLKPSSLRMLYTLFYYEYIRYSLSTQQTEKKELPKPEKDSEINIPEQLFVLVLQIFFDQTCNAYFTTLFNL
jgi:hypothetical protein